MNRSQKLSVAMCTYNGERFLPAQLASVLAQTRLPDELVVCDDRSTDRTLALLEQFRQQAPFPVRIVSNATNLGSTRNFEEAIGLCKGDLITLSDQDDIWYPERLAISERELDNHPEAGLVFSDGDIIDDAGNRTGATLWDSFRFTQRSRASIGRSQYNICLSSRFATGATVTFRAILRDKVLPVGAGWIHDEWIAAATPLFAELRAIPDKLIGSRMHGAQQVGLGARPDPRQRFLLRLARVLLRGSNSQKPRYERLCEQANAFTVAFAGSTSIDTSHAKRLADYSGYARFMGLRLQFPENRLGRLRVIARNADVYFKHRGLRQLILDLAPRRLWENS